MKKSETLIGRSSTLHKRLCESDTVLLVVWQPLRQDGGQICQPSFSLHRRVQKCSIGKILPMSQKLNDPDV